MLDLDTPAQAEAPAYRVLARKYRPANFDALIGQEAMVRTLGNAFARGRLAHAWLLSGVRGVGKTSTARIMAKALNCVGPAGDGGPTISPCGICANCVAIAAGRHIDVLEMDAASNTGVDRMRELLDGVPYGTVQARFRVYIVDEVHMLSTSSFNALLKTLEEPPAHVKFIFATTDVHKVPVTVQSRCQRFDLRRVPVARLHEHFAEIAAAEQVAVESDALELIAEAADGSVRDGLSILDQAIAHGAGTVGAEGVREMLGLADRVATRRLLAALIAGDGVGALAEMRQTHDLGVDPLAVVRDLLRQTHALTLAKLGVAGEAADAGGAALDPAALGHARLHRLWQLLLRAHGEVLVAPVPVDAADMALLRIAHAAGMPDPDELVRRLRGEPAAVPAPAEAAGSAPDLGGSVASATPADFAGLVAYAQARNEALLATRLHDDVRLLGYRPPLIELAPAQPLPADFAKMLEAKLGEWFGTPWRVRMVAHAGGATLRDAERAAEDARRAAALADPAVAALMAAFPGSELLSVDVPLSPADSAADRVMAGAAR